MLEELTTEQKIEIVLDKIRPFIRRDGGDVEFVSFKDGIVYVKMHGACADCMMIDATITEGIEVILMEEVPGVLEVQNISSAL